MISVEQLARLSITACEAVGAEYMLTGAMAYNYYAVPRSTKDVDIVVAVPDSSLIGKIIKSLEPDIVFNPQVQFDTITWGRRHIGRPPQDSGLSVELFELFDDPFVKSQFDRRRRVMTPSIGMEIWIPAAEDIIVQKLRWARPKDLDDARDVLAVQGTDILDMSYIENWCAIHGTTERLAKVLAEIPPM